MLSESVRAGTAGSMILARSYCYDGVDQTMRVDPNADWDGGTELGLNDKSFVYKKKLRIILGAVNMKRELQWDWGGGWEMIIKVTKTEEMMSELHWQDDRKVNGYIFQALFVCRWRTPWWSSQRGLGEYV